MNIFEKGNFQNKFEIYDTDTAINEIIDSIIANYLAQLFNCDVNFVS